MIRHVVTRFLGTGVGIALLVSGVNMFMKGTGVSSIRFLFISLIGVGVIVAFGKELLLTKRLHRVGMFCYKPGEVQELNTRLPKEIDRGVVFFVLKTAGPTWDFYQGVIVLSACTKSGILTQRFNLPIARPYYKSKWRIPNWLPTADRGQPLTLWPRIIGRVEDPVYFEFRCLDRLNDEITISFDLRFSEYGQMSLDVIAVPKEIVIEVEIAA